jgi:hypothetical protein
MNSLKKVTWVVLFVGLGTMFGCSGASMQPDAFEKYLKDPAVPRIAYQICLPEKKVTFDEIKVDVTDIPLGQSLDARRAMSAQVSAGKKYPPNRTPGGTADIETARRWQISADTDNIRYPFVHGQNVKNTAGVFSSSGEVIYLADSTENDEPVFFGFSHERLGDLTGLSVRSESSVQSTYWFIPPKSIPMGRYTEWMAPVSEESAFQENKGISTWWQLVHDREMPIYPVVSNAPKIRYTLINEREYFVLRSVWVRKWDAARLQYVSEHGSEPDQNKYRMIDAKDVVIPGCP